MFLGKLKHPHVFKYQAVPYSKNFRKESKDKFLKAVESTREQAPDLKRELPT